MLLKSQRLFYVMTFGKINKRQWTSSLAVLLSLLIFDALWGYVFDFHFALRPTFFTFTLFFWVLLSIPSILWDARRVQAVVTTLLCLWLEAILIYGRQYYTSIPPGSYSQLFNVLHSFSGAVLSLTTPLDLAFFIPIVIAWSCGKGENRMCGKKLLTRYVAAIIILWASGWGWVWVRGGLKHSFEGASFQWYPQRVAQYTPFGILWDDLENMYTPISEADRESIERWQNEHRHLFADTITSPTDSPERIVLVMVESLESWVINREVESIPIMPTLNEMANDSTALFIPNIVTQVGGGHSSDTQLMALGGMLPVKQGSWALDYPGSLRYSLPRAFKEAHRAETAYFACDEGRNWRQKEFAEVLGFDIFYGLEDYPSYIKPQIDDPSITDTDLAAFASSWISKSGNKPIFVELVTLGLHTPFILPTGIEPPLSLKGDYNPKICGYLQCARYTDNALKILMGKLKTTPDFDKTMIIVMGDHIGLDQNRKQLHEKYPWIDTEPLVPMIIYHSPVQGRIDKYMGQVDIYPSLLQLLNLSDYKWKGLGVSIFNPQHPGLVYSPIYGWFGNTATQPTVKNHLKKAYKVSDLILRYDVMDKE